MDRFFEFVGNHLYLAVGFAVVTVLLLRDLVESLLRKYKLTTAQQAVMLLNQEDAVVIDVREPQEWAKGHIVNARHIPLGELDKHLVELEDFKTQPLIVTCQSGTRSPTACKKLMQAGFEKVYLLKNGMTAWEDAGLPITKSK
ncbi:rhodanese-like domain-containing protein [Methylohalobius crimeensis]|uniref:rhodanese-like domain-containing protein n=1 Tax=Methylohalobius crimeensis TaxID=244365 RepID=UPI0003B67682|nr:rhodanese-like domain-containing protein [Methylohalobius crimeensis]